MTASTWWRGCAHPACGRPASASRLASFCLLAATANVRVSLATVYNTLHQFTEAGLLREVSVDGARTYFDTNVSDHHHYFVEGENRLIDVDGRIRIGEIPAPPEGMEVTTVEVVVRCRRSESK